MEARVDGIKNHSGLKHLWKCHVQVEMTDEAFKQALTDIFLDIARYLGPKALMIKDHKVVNNGMNPFLIIEFTKPVRVTGLDQLRTPDYYIEKFRYKDLYSMIKTYELNLK